jgi:hypothetical protein
MRLLDRILSKATLIADGTEDKKSLQDLLMALANAQLIVIDNVADYYWEQFLSRENRAVGVDDFPCVMPPFPSIFFDFRVRQSSLLYPQFEEVGLWMRIVEKEDALNMLGDDQKQTLFHREDATAILLCWLYVRRRASKSVAEVGHFVFPITNQGLIVPAEDGQILIMSRTSDLADFGTQEQRDGVANVFVYDIIYPSLLALSFMHCKNVRTTIEEPPTKLSRIHKKATGRPLLRYHVLQIDHMKAALKKTGKGGTMGLAQALHICRGYFSSYGQDGNTGLLFGKFKGRFWIPDHVRGNAKRGIVLKDYEVK